MNTKLLAALITLLSLLPWASQAKSPWDKSPVTTEAAPAEEVVSEPVMAEPITPQPVVAETEMAEPATPEIIEPMPAPVASTNAAPNDSIEVIETKGDVLAMPQPTQREVEASPMLLLDFPRRGMDQDKVQSELGSPVEIHSAVGQPPITRWIYTDRVVYFEYTTVLHVVAR